MRSVRTPYFEKCLYVYASTTVYEAFTPWYFATGVDNIQAVVKVFNQVGGTLYWQLYIETAAVRPDSPGSTSLITGLNNGNGEVCYNQAVTTTSAMWFRLGIAYYSSSQSAQAEVGLEASWNQLGMFLGASNEQISASDTQNKVMVATPWFPQTFMTYVKAAYIVNGHLGSGSALQGKIALQTATTSIQVPGAWTTIEAGWRALTSASEANTGQLALSAGTPNDMWVRIGMIYNLSGAGSTESANVSLMITGR